MEIGSEFFENSSKVGNNEYFNLCDMEKRFVLSGRTALQLIAEEIKPKVSEVLLPAYCCSSMVAPFMTQELTVLFYNPFDFDNIIISESIQAVVIMDYFGFLSKKTYDFVNKCKQAGKIIIVDATQTVFSHSNTYFLADYIIASYRKWFDCLCAVVYSKDGFCKKQIDNENQLYWITWRRAARLKEQFIKNGNINKSEFLTLYSNANHILAEDYSGYSANTYEIVRWEEVDSSFIREKRRDNAEYLISEIKKMSTRSDDIQLLFDNIGEEDCPLFVPVLINEKKRNKVRATLIEQNIYCPIHWPIDIRYPYEETLHHKTELSLICDQRYGIEEMKKQISVLSEVLCVFEK